MKEMESACVCIREGGGGDKEERCVKEGGQGVSKRVRIIHL